MDTTTRPAIVLVPGQWLGSWAWDAVSADLSARDYQVTAVTLPGLSPNDPDRACTTLSRQVDGLASAVEAAAAVGSPVAVVAHSGAGQPVSMLLDRYPGAVALVVYVDSGPSADGPVFDASLPTDVAEVALPPFDQLSEVASLEGVSEIDLARFRERAVPEPGPVMRGTVHPTNDARRGVPTTIIACSLPSEVVLQMAHAGHPMMAEVVTLHDLEIVDLPTGHWPMWSRPTVLAAAIARVADRRWAPAVIPGTDH